MTPEDEARFDSIQQASTRNDKMSWQRKQNNVLKLVEDTLHPLQEQILEIMAQQEIASAKINEINAQMILECIHPPDQVVLKDDGTFLCKFCKRTLNPLT